MEWNIEFSKPPSSFFLKKKKKEVYVSSLRFKRNAFGFVFFEVKTFLESETIMVEKAYLLYRE